MKTIHLLMCEGTLQEVCSETAESPVFFQQFRSSSWLLSLGFAHCVLMGMWCAKTCKVALPLSKGKAVVGIITQVRLHWGMVWSWQWDGISREIALEKSVIETKAQGIRGRHWVGLMFHVLGLSFYFVLAFRNFFFFSPFKLLPSQCWRSWPHTLDTKEGIDCGLTVSGVVHLVMFECFELRKFLCSIWEDQRAGWFLLTLFCFFTQTTCEGNPCHFAECQHAFTVTLMLGRKVLPLLSSKIAPGLLVVLHLKVSPPLSCLSSLVISMAWFFPW